ncbi:MAG: hypothetical protein D6776_10925 [Planctomycetota bacterium]|nr:MAG: hypothetical protein D6776_10925 [Planctomycetota bacterium]
MHPGRLHEPVEAPQPLRIERHREPTAHACTLRLPAAQHTAALAHPAPPPHRPADGRRRAGRATLWAWSTICSERCTHATGRAWRRRATSAGSRTSAASAPPVESAWRRRCAGTSSACAPTGPRPPPDARTSPPTAGSRSCFAVSTPCAVVELLADLRAVLARRRLRWFVFGAQAVVVWGRPRLTEDVDVTVELRFSEIPELLGDMGAAGFASRVDDPQAFARETFVLPFVHTATGLALDFVIAGSGLERQFLERAIPIDFGGIEVPVVQPEDLIVAKLLAGRSRDLEDVEGILRERQGHLELDRIRRLLGELESALGTLDLLGPFERMLRTIERGRTD